MTGATLTDRTVLETFAGMTADIVAGIDVGAYLHRLAVHAAELLDVYAVAVLIAGGGDRELDVAGSSGELGALVARHELTQNEGPGLDAFRSGAPVECPELSAVRWPRFAPFAMNAGLAAAHAVPCRGKDDVLGTLAMYATRAGALTSAAVELSRAMANAVSLGVSAFRERERADQLQYALHSRIVIEQAKGMLAERLSIPVGDAFELLRGYSRNHNTKLHDVARDVLGGTLALVP